MSAVVVLVAILAAAPPPASAASREPAPPPASAASREPAPPPASAASREPAPPPASAASREPVWILQLAAGPDRSAPEARVREFALRGSFLDLDDGPGLPALGWDAELAISRRLGAWRVGIGAAGSRSAGTGETGGGFNFNGGVYPPDQTVHASLVTTRLYAHVSRRLVGEAGALELRGRLAIEHYHPVLTLTPDPPFPLYDEHEDYLQFLPLPLLGIELEGPVGAGWQGHALVQAGTAPDWDTGRSEGGPMRMSLTLAELEATAARPVSRHFRVRAGYIFRFAEGTLESPEDTNWIRSREHVLRLGLEFLTR